MSCGCRASETNAHRAHFALTALLAIALLAGACSSGAAPVTTHAPATGVYFGANLDSGNDSASAFNERVGHKAAVYVQFVAFPLDDGAAATLDAFVAQVKAQHGMGMITLEPNAGLTQVTPATADAFADRVAAYDKRGVPMFVRFAHEMNGSWYPWGQSPTLYVSAFRTLAAAVHARAPQSAMVWAPNYGGGYPFSGGRYEAKPGSPDFALLDTDHDGRLTMNDDPYAPYYPGDDAVDWVGMSVYHWGDRYPWGENEVPEAHKFIDIITGIYAGQNGDERAVPDFYGVYAAGHGKPMAVTETAALFNTASTGDSEMEIKQGWWRQVFAPEIPRDFPRIKMINWFEWRKAESEVGGAVVDWRATPSPQLTDAFRSDLPHWLVFAH